ncbi:ATP-binding protein [Neptunicella marina]|uniref:histidine kinase n=1 Tax=Neptunicella marina TaxID=2125989 RepID=A0A8J6IRU1_9ALTE|nr:ATP-binding protein [Neptunicella marina]MBC3765229.1 two-component sensor histidine kinase [Neptunicella marina]
MARLFISLYLVIALSLILLAASLDNLFYANTPPNEPAAEAVGHMVRQLYPKQDLHLLAQKADMTMQWIEPGSMVWPNNIEQKLNKGLPVVLHDKLDRQQLYVKMPDGRLLELTFPQQEKPATSYMLYSSIFFILLSIPLALWVWPLWRDLNALKTATQTLHADGSLAKVSLSRHSPLKTIASAFEQLSNEIKQLLLNKRELTGAVAHELRTPLARLKFAMALKPQSGSNKWQDMAKDISELEQLVQEMLDYSSMETQAPDMDMAEIPVKTLCQEMVKKLSYQHDKKLTIEGYEQFIMADGHFVQRALQNLLQNAIRYANKEVCLRITTQKQRVLIQVDDDGCGVEPELRERIFEPFYRPDSSRDRFKGGAGLGLAIVRRIQQWHHGNCTVETSPLGGARFILSYPAIQK